MERYVVDWDRPEPDWMRFIFYRMTPKSGRRDKRFRVPFIPKFPVEAIRACRTLSELKTYLTTNVLTVIDKERERQIKGYKLIFAVIRPPETSWQALDEVYPIARDWLIDQIGE